MTCQRRGPERERLYTRPPAPRAAWDPRSFPAAFGRWRARPRRRSARCWSSAWRRGRGRRSLPTLRTSRRRPRRRPSATRSTALLTRGRRSTSGATTSTLGCTTARVTTCGTRTRGGRACAMIRPMVATDAPRWSTTSACRRARRRRCLLRPCRHRLLRLLRHQPRRHRPRPRLRRHHLPFATRSSAGPMRGSRSAYGATRCGRASTTAAHTTR